MTPSMSPEEIARLTALAEGGLDHLTRPVSGEQAAEKFFENHFQEWAKQLGLGPGVSEGVTSSDACRHFQAWAAERGVEFPEIRLGMWARQMRPYAFAKIRTFRGGRYADLLLLKARPAHALKQWLRENPSPPPGTNAFRRKGT